MRLLLDTHVFLWWVTDSRRLRAPARRRLEAAEAVFVSAASIWEIAIKSSLGNLDLDPEQAAEAVDASGFLALSVTFQHAARVAQLPPHHRDPFDRLLLAQALSEPLILLTADERLREYGPLVQLL